jgi:hypothetical protein
LFVGSIASHAAAPPPKPRTLLPGGADQWKLTWSDEFDYPDAQLEKK